MAEKQNSGPAPLVSIEKPPSLDGKDANSADHDIDLHGNEKEGKEEYILSGYKLAVILTGLCLSVFSSHWTHPSSPQYGNFFIARVSSIFAHLANMKS